MVTVESDKSSPNFCAVNAVLQPATRLDRDALANGSGSGGWKREQGAVHHLPVAFRNVEHVEFWPDLRITLDLKVFSLLVATTLPLDLLSPFSPPNFSI